MKIPLLKLPSKEWGEEFNKLLQDPYIIKKYNRTRRINDKVEYIKRYLPELLKTQGLIIDLGPGPGEFLEVCRFYGHTIYGIDAQIDDCEMGEEYVRLSEMLTQRQNIPVDYVGFENMLQNGVPRPDASVLCINTQGALEQIFKKHLEGDPLVNHKNCFKLSWKITKELEEAFVSMLLEIKRLLIPGGIFLISANGSKNTGEYTRLMKKCIKEAKLQLVYTDNKCIHKMKNENLISM